MRTILPASGIPTESGVVTAGEERFTVLFTEYQTTVARTVRHGLRDADQHLVEDLSQETFVRLWKHLAAGHAVVRPAGLLRTMASRVLADHYRLARSTREGAADFTDWAAERRLPASAPAEDIAITRLEARTLLVEGLPHRTFIPLGHIRIQAERVLASAVAA